MSRWRAELGMVVACKLIGWAMGWLDPEYAPARALLVDLQTAVQGAAKRGPWD